MPSPPKDEQLPERIGDYRILHLLGRGGMGAVFEAEQDNPHRTIALKILSVGILNDEVQRRFIPIRSRTTSTRYSETPGQAGKSGATPSRIPLPPTS
ncbi:MAG: serine/threonine protein kinase [Chlamydiales bacterium]|jgi:serine/threonine protein kinase